MNIYPSLLFSEQRIAFERIRLNSFNDVLLDDGEGFLILIFFVFVFVVEQVAALRDVQDSVLVGVGPHGARAGRPHAQHLPLGRQQQSGELSTCQNEEG